MGDDVILYKTATRLLEVTKMPQHVKVPVIVPVLLLLPAVFLLVAPSFISFGLEPVVLYVFGGAYLVCSVTYFILKEHQRICIAYLGVFITGTVIVWALWDQPYLIAMLLFAGVIMPLLELNKQVRKAKQK
jgi:hypothetical protein